MSAFGRRIVAPWPVGKYLLLQTAEMPQRPGADRTLLQAGAEVLWDGQPGPHMEALDDQARLNIEHVEKHMGGMPSLDPTAGLSLIAGETDNIDHKLAELKAQMSALEAMRAAPGTQGAIAPPGAVRAVSAPVAAKAVPPPPPMASRVPPPPL